MSIIMVAVDPRQVTVVVDSLMVDSEGTRFAGNKLQIVPTANIVFAMRGNQSSMLDVHRDAIIGQWSFDDCVQHAPLAFESRVDQLLKRAKKDGVPTSFHPFANGTFEELVIAGYSDATQTMRAVIARVSSGGMEVQEISSYFFAPGGGPHDVERLSADGDAKFREMASVLHMDVGIKRIAAWQFQALQDFDATAIHGGDLIAAEVTRTSTTVRNLGAVGGF